MEDRPGRSRGRERRGGVPAAWLLVAAGIVLAVACLVIVATAPAAVRPWAGVAAGFSLTVLGIILMAIRRAERGDGDEDMR